MNVVPFLSGLSLVAICVAAADDARPLYSASVVVEKPVAYWRFTEGKGRIARNEVATDRHVGEVQGNVSLLAAGPRPKTFPAFEVTNQAAAFGEKAAFVRIKDPGERSGFDFTLGDTITLEAWVSPRQITDGQQVYIIGKGRTQNRDVPLHNQNWALRLRGQGGTARVSFLFRDERNRPNAGDEDWHRWTSTAGFAPSDSWHHVAVTYTFGKGASVKGYIDGTETSGTWDMGGQTDLGPVVDNDEIWIGSSMGGSIGATFNGLIDEVAIFRSAIAPSAMKQRFTFVAPAREVAALDLPNNAVRVEIFERSKQFVSGPAAPSTVPSADSTPGIPIDPADASWNSPPDVITETYEQPALAFSAVVNKYSERGAKLDRSAPFMIRGSAKVDLPEGEHRLLMRSLAGARLLLDGKVIATNPFITRRYDDNQEVPDQTSDRLVDGVRLLAPGHAETLATVRGDGQVHVFTFEAFVGGKQLRPEVGELSVSISLDGEPFQLLSPKLRSEPLTDEGWNRFVDAQRTELAALNHKRRNQPKELAYWKMRHELARGVLSTKAAPTLPEPTIDLPVQNEVDRFINAKLAVAGVRPAPLLDDDAFLRRATLDTTGLIPSPEQIATFQNDHSPTRRATAIDRLLANPRWADHWVSYWQDVLAENPAMLKATLNNTGPFRWWLHEALSDRLPMDRLVTQLISMEGSQHHGGPAGFLMASQNDVPTAAKAQIISQAFLGMEMKCARCHDAPYHSFNQEELFNLAAMLDRKPVKVPASSSVDGLASDSVVQVTLNPGTAVAPHWPFADMAPAEPLPGVLRNPKDTRERLAAIITDPRNERFPQVLVNRVWKRYLGWGLVDPVDDWETALPSHKELLVWLARELVAHDYDLQHIARLILNSHAYQRAATPDGTAFAKSDARLFHSPARRRMSAEQVVDSLFGAAGKSLDCEQLNMDVDARRNINDFNNLGRPRSAWEFAALSNERDRPALAMPKAQSIVDVLAAFGWRETRPDPRTVRDDSANVLQPATLANGVMGTRITRLSIDSAFTALALKEQPIGDLVDKICERILSRVPTSDERALFTRHLAEGYEDRVVIPDPNAPPPKPRQAYAVSWSNHLNANATRIKLEQEKEVRAGDPPTDRLRGAWRERLEDSIWSLMLSPEFVFLP